MPRAALAPLITLAAVLSSGPLPAQEQREPLWQGDAAFLSFDEPGIYSQVLPGPDSRFQVYRHLGLPQIAATYLLSADGAKVLVYWDPEDEQITYEGADGQALPSRDDELGAGGFALAAVIIENGHGMSYLAGWGYAPTGSRTNFPHGYEFRVNADLLNAPHHRWDATAIDLSAQEANGIRRTGVQEIGSRGDLEITRFTTPQMEFIAVSDDELIMRIGVVGHPSAGSTERAPGESTHHCANRIFAERQGITPDDITAFLRDARSADPQRQWAEEYARCLGG